MTPPHTHSALAHNLERAAFICIGCGCYASNWYFLAAGVLSVMAFLWLVRMRYQDLKRHAEKQYFNGPYYH